MTLDEAIKIQEDESTPWVNFTNQERENARKLGIEALKWRQLMENDYGSWCGPPLPGETK